MRRKYVWTINTGSHIGYPIEVVDTEGGGTPVAIDTAGNVDKSVYEQNSSSEINGKCIDLDGFHHGDVIEQYAVPKQACGRGVPRSAISASYSITQTPTCSRRPFASIGNMIDGTKFGGYLRDRLRTYDPRQPNAAVKPGSVQ